ncbi:MAG: AIR synthase related protein [Candidatus Magasanikbacteria bacterium]
MFTPETIDFAALTEEQIKSKLQEYRISLTVDEILKIQNEILKRPPSIAECVLWSIQGSEHSSYKSSRPFLKQFHTSGPNVLLGPGEDAGIVEICRDSEGRKYGIVLSHESHNHPSQIVPYEGAATGVGGNVRDVCCMGAKVIACADPLRFGKLSENKSKWISDGVVSGIAGYGNPIGVPNIAGDIYYDESFNENCLVNVVTLGVLREDEIIHSRAPENASGYDLILIGKPTDNSGFGGASFASLEMKEEDKEMNKGAVQEPNAFLKRHILKSTYALFKLLKDKNLFDKIGFKDLGAGGIACASVELADAAGYGAEVNIDLVPQGMTGLHPSVILCSETQERFMWVAHPDVTPIILEHYNKTFDLPNVSEGACAAVVGKIRDDGRYIVTAGGVEIINAKASDVTSGLLYNRPYSQPARECAEPNLPEPSNDTHQTVIPAQAGIQSPHNVVRLDSRFHGNDNDKRWSYNEIFLKILAHENVASRVPVYEQYDKQVQGITVFEPGEADAGVMRPFMDEKYPAEIKNVGFALSVDSNPRYGKIDAYWGGANAVIESMRNVATVGAVPWALTDCLCYGNPEKPEQMWEFVEGTRGVSEAGKNIHLKSSPDSPVPIISGNVSLYNESKGKPIAPSAIISCLGKLNDVNKAITMSFKQPESILLMVGERKNECGGSVYYDLFGELGANVPKPDFKEAENQIFALTDAIDAGLILSAHDISDGGIATTLAEMSFKNEIGLQVSIPCHSLANCHSERSEESVLSKNKMDDAPLRSDKCLWSETGGFVLEVAPESVEVVSDIFKKYDVEAMLIGKTTDEKRLVLSVAEGSEINDCVDCSLTDAKKAWTDGLRNKL